MLFWIWVLSFTLAFVLACLVVALYTIQVSRELLKDSDEYEEALERTLKAYRRAIRSSEKHRACLEKMIAIQEQLLFTLRNKGWTRGGFEAVHSELPSASDTN